VLRKLLNIGLVQREELLVPIIHSVPTIKECKLLPYEYVLRCSTIKPSFIFTLCIGLKLWLLK